MKLYATKEQVNGHAWVNVSEDTEDESRNLWMELGYVPREDDSEAPASASESDLDSMTIKELEAFVEAEGLEVDLPDYRLKAEKLAAVEAALAAREAE